MMPKREALAALLLPALLAAALLLVPERAGPGPLGLLAGLAALHAALLSPALARGAAPWGLLPLPLALPALATAAYGHPGTWPLLGALLLVALASLAGAAARTLPASTALGLYLPSMALLFAAPYALRYLVLELGSVARAAAWLHVSPFAAAERIAAGGALPGACAALLLLWPAWALARRGR